MSAHGQPTKLADVQALDKRGLDELCNRNNIRLGLSKKAKINLVCLAFGIPTCGPHAACSVESFNPKGLSQLDLAEFSQLTSIEIKTHTRAGARYK